MEEILYLKWKNYSSSFFMTLTEYQNKERLCDSTLACHGKFYPVHRLILSLSSEYFEEIFERTPCKHPFLILNDIEPVHLEAILSFIYKGEVKISHDKFHQFIKAAEILKIKGLILNNNNLSESWQTNEEYKTSSLDDHSLNAVAHYASGLSYTNNSLFEDIKPNLSHFVALPIDNDRISCRDTENCPLILDPVVSVDNFNISLKSNSSGINSPHIRNSELETVYQDIEKSQEILNSRSEKQKPQGFGARLLKKPRKSTAKSVRVNEENIVTSANIVSYKDDNLEAETRPLRKSPRKRKRVNYASVTKSDLAKDNEKDLFEYVEASEQSSKIIILAYSGGNYEEFEDGEEFKESYATNIIENDDNMAIKIEPNDITIDDNGFLEETSFDNIDINSDPLALEEPVNPSPLSNSDSAFKVKFKAENFFPEEPSSAQTDYYYFNKSFDRPGCSYDTMTFAGDDQELSGKVIKCRFCPYTSHGCKSMRVHERAHSYEISYKCKYCWYRAIRKSHVASHENNKHMQKKTADKLMYVTKKKYQLPEAAVDSFEIINDPLNKSDSVNVPQNNGIAYSSAESGLFKCKLCSYSSNYEGSVKSHMRAHKDKKLLRCNLCSYTAVFKYVMERHKLIHRNCTVRKSNDKRKLKCSFCNYTVDSLSSMTRHQNTHSGANRYSCRFCSFRSITKDSVTQHELIHSRSRKRVVKEEQRRQINSHAEKMPNTCKLCPFKSAVKRFVYYHELSHDEKNILKCPYCLYCTSNLKYLNKHKYKWHKKKK